MGIHVKIECVVRVYKLRGAQPFDLPSNTSGHWTNLCVGAHHAHSYRYMFESRNRKPIRS